MTYLITFSCYGCHLHGDERGSVDRNHNKYLCPDVEPSEALHSYSNRQRSQSQYHLDRARREIVIKAVQEVCTFRSWCLVAAHARTTHVHVVVEAELPPEPVMNTLKTIASRRLNESMLDPPDRKR